MKTQLRKFVRMLAGLPVIGRFVRIGVAVIRLPEFRAVYLDTNHRQHVFETEQLPTLLQTLSDLNRRQIANDIDKENFVKSIPVVLRKITRDLIDTNRRQHVFETEQLPTLLQTLSDLNRRQIASDMESVTNSVGYLLGRVEFVRRELMFEMRYGASAPSIDGDQIKTKTEILDQEKLAAARSGRLRLNLGCGHVPVDGYLNVDRRPLPGVDIVAEVDELPFVQSELDEIFSAHLLEHFPQEQLRRDLLPYWVGLLKPGGVLGSVVPDADSMVKEYVGGAFPYSSLREVTFGAQDYDGDFHYNMFVPEQLEELLKEAGLTDIEWLATGRKNGACFEMEFRAVKK